MLEERDGEIIVTGYGFCVDKIPYKIPYFLIPRRVKEAVRILADTKGLVGVAPLEDKKTLVVYETLNDAKRAKNILLSEGIRVYGKEIEEIETTAESTVSRYV